MDEFIDNTHFIEGDEKDTITIRKTGAFNKALITRLTYESNSNDWEVAKEEWRVTGRVWYIPLSHSPWRLPEVHINKHPQECICGHKVAWHFEVENTENGTLEILGSEHITNWMIIRHLKEVMGIPTDAITEEKILEWIKESVKTMKAEWWWTEYGDDWEEYFNEVKELDLRINVRSKGKYYDHATKRYEQHWTIAKTKKGSLGKMASIVWRWNHPDNQRKQIDTRGYPNERLWKDVQLLYARMDRMNDKLDGLAKVRNTRIEEVMKTQHVMDKEIQERREKLQEEANQIREETGQEYDDTALIEACSYYDIPLFTTDMGGNSWEIGFLHDMRNRIIRRNELSEKQLNTLMRIIAPDSAVDIKATSKQLRYIVRLGGECEDEITKSQASELIESLLNERVIEG